MWTIRSTTVCIDHGQMHAISDVDGGHSPLRIVLPAVRHLDGGSVESQRRKLEVEAACIEVGLTLDRVPREPPELVCVCIRVAKTFRSARRRLLTGTAPS